MFATITFGEILKVSLISGAIGFVLGGIVGNWLTLKVLGYMSKKGMS